MDVIEQLIKSLQEAKAELEKGAAKKKMPAPPPPVNTEDHPPKLDQKGAMKLVKEEEPHKDDPNHEKKEKKAASKIKDEAEDILDLHKEELMCSANGQWHLKKDAANPALAPKDKKVKMLQAQVDAGTYKPDSSKIAGAMIKPLKKEEEVEKADGLKAKHYNTDNTHDWFHVHDSAGKKVGHVGIPHNYDKHSYLADKGSHPGSIDAAEHASTARGRHIGKPGR